MHRSGTSQSRSLGTLISIAVAGVLLALLCTIFTSRSVSRPLRALVTQLNHTEVSGDLSERLTAGRAVRELALLADAYNRVADSAQRTRRQLEIAKDAAQSANRLKDEFLTNVSHELRTPLNGVLGMTDLLLQTPLDADQQDFAATVRTSGETLVTIIDDILTFSQLQTGRLTLNVQPFDWKSCSANRPGGRRNRQRPSAFALKCATRMQVRECSVAMKCRFGGF